MFLGVGLLLPRYLPGIFLYFPAVFLVFPKCFLLLSCCFTRPSLVFLCHVPATFLCFPSYFHFFLHGCKYQKTGAGGLAVVSLVKLHALASFRKSFFFKTHVNHSLWLSYLDDDN